MQGLMSLMVVFQLAIMVGSLILMVIFVMAHKQMANAQEEVASSMRQIAKNLKSK